MNDENVESTPMPMPMPMPMATMPAEGGVGQEVRMFSGKDKSNILGEDDGEARKSSAKRRQQAVITFEKAKSTCRQLFEYVQQPTGIGANGQEDEDSCITTQRFSKVLNGRFYHVRVLLSKKGSVSVSFFDVKEGRTVKVRQMKNTWLDTLSSDCRHSLLTSALWFRENAGTLLGVSNDRPIELVMKETPHKPKRRPPPVPSNENENELGKSGGDNDDDDDDDDKLMEEILAETTPVKARPDFDHTTEKLQEELRRQQAIIDELKATNETLMSRLMETEQTLETKIKLNEQLSNDLKNKSDDEIGPLKLRLMNSESKVEELERQVATKHKENEDYLGEVEKLIASLENDHAAKLEEADMELRQMQARYNSLSAQMEEVRDRSMEAENRAEELQRKCEDVDQESVRLQGRLMEMNQLMDKQKADSDAFIADLKEQLEVMTESKNQNKEYGAQMKAKLVGLQNSVAVQFETLEKEKAIMEDKIQLQEKQIEQLQEEGSNLHVALENSAAESQSMQNEIARLTAELERALRSEAELEQAIGLAEDARARLNEEYDALVMEKRERVVEFENQLRKKKLAHEEEMGKLKVQIFDANEQLRAKESEVAELGGYVTSLLNQSDAMLASICEACKAKTSHLQT